MDKKLGKEYRNTYIVQFRHHVSVPKVLSVLQRLGLISGDEFQLFWGMKDMTYADPLFEIFQNRMNEIAPDGCEFSIRHSYKKNELSKTMEKYISVGFFPPQQCV